MKRKFTYLVIALNLTVIAEAQQDSTEKFTFPVYQLNSLLLKQIVVAALEQLNNCDPISGYSISLSIDVDNPVDVSLSKKDTTISFTYSPHFYYEDSGPSHSGVIFFDTDTIFIRHSGIWSWFGNTGECATFSIKTLASWRKEQESYKKQETSPDYLPSWIYKYASCSFKIKNGLIFQKNICSCIE